MHLSLPISSACAIDILNDIAYIASSRRTIQRGAGEGKTKQMRMLLQPVPFS